MKKGISLIVLIVTIIVMIIIAGATIITLVNTDIINQAEQGKAKWDEASLKENLSYLGATNLFMIKINGQTYKKTNMVDVISAVRKQYGSNAFTIEAEQVEGFEIENTLTNDEMISMYYYNQYCTELFEEVKDYVKTIPGSGLTDAQVETHLRELSAKYVTMGNAEGQTIEMPTFDTTPLFGNPIGYKASVLAEMMNGNTEAVDDWLEFHSALRAEISLKLRFNINGNIYYLTDDGNMKQVTFVINKDGIITGYEGNVPKNLVIPATVDGIKVKAIANYAFAGYQMSYNDLADMTLPVNIQFQGYNPDLDSPNLIKTNMQAIETITLPEGLLAIGKMSFIGLENLTSVEFPSSLKAIGLYFDDVNPVLATNPDPYNAIASPDNNNANKAGYTFCNCFKLTSITIPNTCAVGMGAFANCKMLTTVNHEGFYTTGAQNSYMLTPYGG